MISVRIFLVAALVPAALPALGQDPPPPIRPQTRKAEHQRWGYVRLSDDRRHDGLVWTTRGKPVRIFDRKKSTYRDIKWRKIARIEQAPDEEWLEREWRWKEGGSDVKVYTDRYYRAAKYRTTLTLKSGEKIEGDVVIPVFVRTRKTLQRLELHKRFKSPKPQPKKELEPLVYVREIVFTDKEPEPDAGEAPAADE
jgi:hypothetical protein